jgi:GntR family transcriptional repressor for pyruvate dehydrogenase complex
MIITTPSLVVKKLLDLIVKGTVKPGDKLPSTDRIARETGTSIISAREAIKNLATIGVIEIRHGRGIFILNGRPVIEELLEARKVIECYNAMMAAQHADPQMLKDLEKLLVTMDEDIRRGDAESYSGKDYNFHLSLGMGSGNRILLKTLENIRSLLQYLLLAINRVPGNLEKSSLLHWGLFTAISNKDSGSASSIMAQHIDDATTAWKKYNESICRQEED